MAIWVFLTWIFFGTTRLFFENFFIVPKGPLQFFHVLEHNRCLKIPKGPPFQSLRHYETVQNCHFSSDTRFSQNISPKIFFNTIRNLKVISGVKRYIRTFDVISEVYSVSLRRRQRFENKCSELLKRYPSTEGFLWVKLLREFFTNDMSIF